MEDIVRLVVENARRLLTDADVLARTGSHRTATSLCILSLEESGKASLLLWDRLGLLEVQPPMLRQHSEKQRIIVAYSIMIGINKVGMIVEKDDPRGDATSDPEFVEQLSRHIQASSALHKIGVEHGLNDLLKEGGFYTDIGEDLKVKLPHGFFSAQLFEHFRKSADTALEMIAHPLITQRAAAAIYCGYASQLPSAKQIRACRKELESFIASLCSPERSEVKASP